MLIRFRPHAFCRTSQMSHGRDWRDSWLCTRRDNPGRWLWRLVGLLVHFRTCGTPGVRYQLSPTWTTDVIVRTLPRTVIHSAYVGLTPKTLSISESDFARAFDHSSGISRISTRVPGSSTSL